MTFRDYFLLNEAFLSELPIIAKQYDIAEAQSLEIKLQDAGIEMSKELIAYDHDLKHNCKLSYAGRTKLVKSLKDKVLKALILIHETEYKVSQMQKFYGGINVNVEPYLLHLCHYVRHYLLGVLFIRSAIDLQFIIHFNGNPDHTMEIAKKLLQTPNQQLVPEIIKVVRRHGTRSKKMLTKYPHKGRNYDLAFLELYDAKTLSQHLIGISKTLNAIHDSGPLLTHDPSDDNTLSYEPPFTLQELDMLSNLNYRKLDKELSQELSK